MEYEICSSESGQAGRRDVFDAVESRLMLMTYCAHRELLYEKIKERLEKEEGAKLDKIAELLVEASRNRWRSRQEFERKDDELKDKLGEAFGQ